MYSTEGLGDSQGETTGQWEKKLEIVWLYKYCILEHNKCWTWFVTVKKRGLNLFCFTCVTAGNSLSAPGTLGSYQTLDWARLAHAGVSRTERNHSYHLIHNIYWDITSSQHMVLSWYITSLVQYIRWVTYQLHHHRSTTSTASTGWIVDVKRYQPHLWVWKKLKKKQYQLWGLASKHFYYIALSIINNHYQ